MAGEPNGVPGNGYTPQCGKEWNQPGSVFRTWLFCFYTGRNSIPYRRWAVPFRTI